MIRDQLVCHIRDDRIQQRLLAESTLSLENAIKIATSMEQAKKILEDIYKCRDSEAAVMKVQPRQKSNFQDYVIDVMVVTFQIPVVFVILSFIIAVSVGISFRNVAKNRKT